MEAAVNEMDQQAARLEAAPEAVAPEESSWRFEQGDEIVTGRSAVKALGGGFRYEAILAWDDDLHALVVVKVVRPGLVDDERTLRGLASEVELLERLNHPVLLRSFGAELGGPRPHVVLEHLEGPRLSSLLRRYGPLPVEQLVPLALQLCSAVHYLGVAGVAHLDIKPSNIIMGGPPRLIDLSVARTVDRCAEISSAVGTDAYMAPEQCRPGRGHPLGAAADVWGIGATLFRAVSGQRPFRRGDHDANDPSERWPQLTDEPRFEALDRVPTEIADPIARCLSFDPADRPRPAELAAELEPVLEALPKPRISKLKPRIRR
jgi:eukaryotic-like serine/threonine-protein kinase